MALRFDTSARRCFAFLEQRGFALVEITSDMLRYRSDDVTLEIWRDPNSYELSLTIGSNSGDMFNLPDFIALEDRKRAAAYRDYQAGTAESVAQGLQSLADDVGRYAERALAGDAEFFAQVDKLRKERAAEFRENLQAEQARRRASNAWTAKDYAGVIAALESIENSLSSAEQARLRYCRNHVGE